MGRAAGTGPATGVPFGRTRIATVTGELTEQAVDLLVHAANARGVMGAGPAGGIRLAGGPAVEREAMARAPLELGSALLTGAGRLAEGGVGGVIHAVVGGALGEPSDPETVRRATEATLRLAETTRFRSLACPPLGGGAAPGQLPVAAVAPLMVEETVAHLRRSSSRLERIVFVVRLEEDAAVFAAAVARARERAWRVRA